MVVVEEEEAVAEEALERLLRLGLVHHATPPSAHATAHASAAGAAGLSGGSGSCSLADDRSDSGSIYLSRGTGANAVKPAVSMILQQVCVVAEMAEGEMEKKRTTE